MRPLMLFGIYREQVFSPGKVREDAAILDAVLAELSDRTFYEVRTLRAEALDARSGQAGWVLSMAQSARALRILGRWQEKGARVINSVQSVRNCYRESLIHLLAESGVPIPPSRILPSEEVEEKISFGSRTRYWLKRGDVHAMEPADVAMVTSQEELKRALDHFYRREIGEILVQEHLDGQAIKFYGVGPGEYFSAFLWPSGREVTAQMKRLRAIAQESAEALGLEIYGGDAVLCQDGRVVVIDFNDWPSFSPCRRPAAKGIARHLSRICKGDFDELSNAC